MKKMFFVLAFMLVGSFAFANNTEDVVTVDYDNAIEFVDSIDFSNVADYSITEHKATNAFDCLVTFTFIFEDGTSTTRTVLFIGASCAEVFEAMGLQ